MIERPTWDWAFAREVLPDVLHAFLTYTLGITAASSVVAMLLGLVLALGRRSHVRPLAITVGWVIEFVRSTPIPIQLFFVYFGLASTGLRLSGVVTGVLVFGVHYACYMSEIYRAGIEAIPKGQWEACTALSLSPSRTWRRVVLPQVARRILPSVGNQVIALFKETPFLVVIGVTDMVTMAYDLGGDRLRYTEPLTIAGVIFLLASYPTSVLMRKLESRLVH